MSRKAVKITVLVVAAILIVIDQVTKFWAVTLLRDGAGGTSVTVIPGLLKFDYLENAAAAMGMFDGMIYLVMIMSAAVSIAIIVGGFLYKNHTWASYTSMALLLAGGIGNLIDRLINVNPNGDRVVVDFIHIEFFPYIFNFADCCVTMWAVLLLLHAFILARREKKLKEQAG